MSKTAIVILSDPKSGTEEALGRLVNGLAAALDYKQHGEEVSIRFQAAGTRWPAELEKADHPFHGLYEAVKDEVGGVSCACADVFGARADVEKSGYTLLTDNGVPGTSGLASFRQLANEGYTVLTF